MAARRTPSSRPGPRGRTGPGRTPARGAGRVVPPAGPGPTALDTHERRPRFTGRMAVLVLVLAVLTVSYASSFRAYLQQRSQINRSQSQIRERQASIESLNEQNKRLHDPAYLREIAREQLGYVMPGQTLYVVSQDGKPLDSESTLSSPTSVGTKPTPPGWWTRAWDSVEEAGNPSTKPAPLPATTIHGKTG